MEFGYAGNENELDVFIQTFQTAKEAFKNLLAVFNYIVDIYKRSPHIYIYRGVLTASALCLYLI